MPWVFLSHPPLETDPSEVLLRPEMDKAFRKGTFCMILVFAFTATLLLYQRSEGHRSAQTQERR